LTHLSHIGSLTHSILSKKVEVGFFFKDFSVI
jgi:hypothetical protein